ncbi:MAG: hypothetical protein KF861_15760, partial [Planctomycetaceae bacterium]|nr:hypothetical protein [Planctomycetaceae bacterium]
GFETVAIAGSAVKLSYRFEDVPVGVQNLEFIYEAPMLIVNVPVALNLPQIPVPPWAPDGVP